MYSTKNKTKLLRAGTEYFNALLELIGSAKESIHLQTYIYAEDETGILITTALKQAVQRKVEVYLLVDGYASQSLSNHFVQEIKDSGIHFRFFEPIFKSKYFYFGRRLHHKVMVVDAQYAVVAGANIADRYNDTPDNPAWLDFALSVEGEIAKELCIICWKIWNTFPKNRKSSPCETKSSLLENTSVLIVNMVRNDWVRNKNEISATYIKMLKNAQHEVTILCSYFLPGKKIRKQIILAIQRGVKIRIIAAGVSDILMAKSAERWLYDWLLRNKIELYEYQKTVLHGKLGVCDDKWMTIGSYNINNISAYASIELNLNVEDADFTKATREKLDQIIRKDCIRVTMENHVKTNNIFKQFGRWFSYEFIRSVFYLFTFYFKQRR
jgi:cardiolipin synthase A/B